MDTGAGDELVEDEAEAGCTFQSCDFIILCWNAGVGDDDEASLLPDEPNETGSGLKLMTSPRTKLAYSLSRANSFLERAIGLMVLVPAVPLVTGVDAPEPNGVEPPEAILCAAEAKMLSSRRQCIRHDFT